MLRRLVQRLSSLRVRIIILLSIAILPLGVVAIYQTAAVVADARELEERNMFAQTLRAVNTERALLRRAFGAADALGAAALALEDDVERCSEVMAGFVRAEAPYVFAGFIGADGVMTCTSTGGPVDFSDTADWRAFQEAPRPTIAVSRNGAASGQSVMIATVPVYFPAGDLRGAASVSLPHSLTDALLAAPSAPLEIALVDRDGNVLSASTGIGNTAIFEALGITRTDIDRVADGLSFSTEGPDGSRQNAILVPLLDDRIYVVGLWNSSSQPHSVNLFDSAAPLFPVLMWVTALLVAIFAVNQLVLRHLVRIERKMSNFSVDAPSDGFVQLSHAPPELRSIASTYNGLIDHILADRAVLEESIRERELLLREVHHRVKNNLQLIVSILNMQLRTVEDGTAKAILRRVQDRVLSLSAIHKALYTGNAVSVVRADRLLAEVVQSTFSVAIPTRSGIETRTDFAPITLDSDQAVPLALLTNELVTNAVKYVGQPGTGTPFIRVTLDQTGSETVLEVANSTGEPVLEPAVAEGTGLGAQLIEAFSSQLDGSTEVDTSDQCYRSTIRFTANIPDEATSAGPAQGAPPAPRPAAAETG